MRRGVAKIFQQGLTLAEIGMALFIISIGALSIATVYLQRAQVAPAAVLHSRAEQLVSEMAQRISSTLAQQPQVHFENAIGVLCKSDTQKNDAQAAAIGEVACWQERAAQLPNGAGALLLDTQTVPPTYVVTVSWTQPRGGLASLAVRVAVPTTANAATKSLDSVRAARAAN